MKVPGTAQPTVLVVLVQSVHCIPRLPQPVGADDGGLLDVVVLEVVDIDDNVLLDEGGVPGKDELLLVELVERVEVLVRDEPGSDEELEKAVVVAEETLLVIEELLAKVLLVEVELLPDVKLFAKVEVLKREELGTDEELVIIDVPEVINVLEVPGPDDTWLCVRLDVVAVVEAVLDSTSVEVADVEVAGSEDICFCVLVGITIAVVVRLEGACTDAVELMTANVVLSLMTTVLMIGSQP